MSKLKFWQLMIRLGLLLGLAGLMLIALQPDLPAHAETAARPPLQDGYPIETEEPYGPPPPDDGYPLETPDLPPTLTFTPQPGITQQPTNTLPPFASPTTLVVTPTVVTPTPNLSQTAELDPFRTEDAEMSGSQNGTPTTPTPGGTPSPTASATSTPEDMNRLTALEPEDSGFEMNWGLFWIGFSIPVVGACGVVLYLLDRRPEYFRPKRK